MLGRWSPFVSCGVYRMRSGRCFENRECSLRVIRDLFVLTLLLWPKAIVLEGVNFNDLYVSSFCS